MKKNGLFASFYYENITFLLELQHFLLLEFTKKTVVGFRMISRQTL